MFISRSFTTRIRNTTIENINKQTGKNKEKFSSKMIENWTTFWKNVYLDYKEVVIDVGKECKEKPLKVAGIISSLSFLAVCAKNNPDEVCFRDAVLKSAGDVFSVSVNIQREDSVKHLRTIEKSYNANSIRRLNLGILSLMWIDEFSNTCDTYECNCNYLQVPSTEIFRRVIDVGFMNKWWLLGKHMEDYDVNY